jgi:ABC-2 type transport system ATP-binding protein
VLFSSHQLDLVERICDRVGIVASGRMVACGSVDELRRQGPEQIVVDVEGGDSRWVDGLANAALVRADGSRLLLQLDEGADDQEILQAALKAGPVREFARRRPPLTELFRHVVSVADDRAAERDGHHLLTGRPA